MAELRKLGDRALGAAIIAKGYYRVKCGHDHPISAAECLRQQIGEKNDRHLMVATQDTELVRVLREVPGVPLLRLNGPVPVLEEPSVKSKQAAAAGEDKKLKASDWEKPKLPVLREHEAKVAEAMAAAPKKRKGPKGANPLSCMKPKKNKQVD